jgi:phage gp36-like protein
MAHSPAYCTAADLLALAIADESELIQLTDRAGLGIIDEARVIAAAETAAIEIDPYLAPRTPVPLASVPDPVRRLACVLTRFYLYTQDPTEHVQRQYDSAIKTLTAIAKGGILIGAEVPAPPADDGPQFGSIAPVWHRDPASGGLG